MRHLVRSLLLFSFLVTTTSIPAFGAELLTMHMTEIPGQTMMDENEPGTALEIVRTLVKRSGYQLRELFFPWTRAVKTVEKKPMGIIAPFARTPLREKKFTWVAKLYDLKFGFVSMKTPINDIETARKLGSIGVWRKTYMEETLRNAGFINLVPVLNDVTLARMLVRGRFEAWYGPLNEAAYKFRGIDKAYRKDIRFGSPVSITPVWLAGGYSLPDHVAEKLRTEIMKMNEDGTIHGIMTRYGMEEFK